MSKNRSFESPFEGKTLGEIVTLIVSGIREVFVKSSMILSIFTVMGIDIILGGISMYLMFQDVDFLPAALLAMLFSIALSSVSFTMWRILTESKGYSWIVFAIGAVASVLDIYVDMAFTELLHGSGDVWLFLQPAAMQEYPRPPLWWAFLALVTIITAVNEPLSAMLVNMMQEGEETKKRIGRFQSIPKKQQGKNTQYQRPQPKNNQSRQTNNPRPLSRPATGSYSYPSKAEGGIPAFNINDFLEKDD